MTFKARRRSTSWPGGICEGPLRVVLHLPREGSPRSSREERDVFSDTCFRTSEVDHIPKGGGGKCLSPLSHDAKKKKPKKTFILNLGAFIQ